MLPVASPKGSTLPGQWDSQEASDGGEPEGEQRPPASPSEVAADAMGLCPSGGRHDQITPLSPLLGMAWGISGAPELLGIKWHRTLGAEGLLTEV